MATSRVFLALILALATISFAPPSRAADTFTEDWSHGLSSWVSSGDETPTTACDANGCILRIAPGAGTPSDGETMLLTHALATPVAGRFAIDYRFWSDKLSSDTDVDVGMHFDHGGLRTHPTEFITVNNGLSIYSYADGLWQTGFAFYKPRQWIDIRLIVDFDLHLAQAQLHLANGLSVPSLIIPIDTQATQVQDVTLYGVSWTSRTSGFSIGSYSAGPTTDCFDPVGTLDGVTRAPIQQTLGLDLNLNKVCDVLDSVVSFGDGTLEQLGDTVDTTVQHAFDTVGAFQVQVTSTVPTGDHILVNHTINVYDPNAPATVPDAPTGLLAAADDGIVGLSWTDTWDGGAAISGHDVYRSTNGGAETRIASGISGTQYADYGVSNTASYTYRVTARNSVGASLPSLPDTTGGPPADATAPDAPRGLSATHTATRVTLTWIDGADGGAPVRSHNVYRGLAPGEETLYASGVGSSFADTMVQANVTYSYVVTAVNAVGESAASLARSATPGSVRLDKQQTAAGVFFAGAGDTDLLASHRFVLAKTTQPGETLQLAWTRPAILGLRFFDANGASLGDCVAAPGASSLHCDAPTGARQIDVIGTGVDAPWHLVYTYVLWV